jgi:phenylalanyl-tRNA synthetase alpha chain
VSTWQPAGATCSTSPSVNPPDIESVRRAGAGTADQLRGAVSLDELRDTAADLLGKKGSLAAVKQQLGSLAPDDRKTIGQAVNEAMAVAQRAHDERRAELAAVARRAQLEVERLDLTEIMTRPRLGHLHPVTQAWQRLEDVFVGLGFQIAEGPEVETDYHNFQALNMGPGHPARSSFDTLFVDWGEPGTTVLRTHTSPVQIRVMERQRTPIYAVMPGRVFRRDTPDATHMPVFHQLEGLVVDKRITFGHLAGIIQAFTEAFFGAGFSSRLRPSYFPFTEPSAEFDIQRPDGSWLELGGCGMVHPDVLGGVGIDPAEFSGFAFGFGIDRMAKEFNGVDDMRELFTNDLRVLGQF